MKDTKWFIVCDVTMATLLAAVFFCYKPKIFSYFVIKQGETDCPLELMLS